MISVRTKAALQAAKARGTKLGGRRRHVIGINDRGKKVYGEVVSGSADDLTKARAVIQQRTDARASDIAPTIKALQAAGATSLRAIAAKLNEAGIPTAKGNGTWSAVQVQRVLARI